MLGCDWMWWGLLTNQNHAWRYMKVRRGAWRYAEVCGGVHGGMRRGGQRYVEVHGGMQRGAPRYAEVHGGVRGGMWRGAWTVCGGTWRRMEVCRRYAEGMHRGVQRYTDGT